VRTGALLAAFALATAVAAGIGDAALAAHQIAFQLFIFLALVLDALAIAGQVLVGRGLGAGDAGGAATAASRLLVLSVGAGCALGLVLLATTTVVPPLFTDDAQVIEQAGTLWPLFALMQPAAAAVFALDGILIGAGDVRYLAGSMVLSLVVYAPAVLLVSAQGWGIGGVWAALLVLMAVRLATTYARFAGRRWAVTGAG
jgi:Na+-driven multidrug efflux pump